LPPQQGWSSEEAEQGEKEEEKEKGWKKEEGKKGSELKRADDLQQATPWMEEDHLAQAAQPSRAFLAKVLMNLVAQRLLSIDSINPVQNVRFQKMQKSRILQSSSSTNEKVPRPTRRHKADNIIVKHIK